MEIVQHPVNICDELLFSCLILTDGESYLTCISWNYFCCSNFRACRSPCSSAGLGNWKQLLFLCWIPDYGHFWLIRPWDSEWVWGRRFHPPFTIQGSCILSILRPAIVQSIRMVSVAKFYLRTEGCGQDDVNLQAQTWDPSFFRETQLYILAVLSPWG